ncbi:hypothetical protein [Paenibacillus soyae]|uniref:Uncharacterized protein n=1 Tax=Paenibacillus soyae TaxID=2969249 RepID=A0A9X2MNS0_9BACL|nr:hypothetical protein [Paenibacillus soyae]MCR2803474.1 hypothetical protein [Paenibacillus soyae]
MLWYENYRTRIERVFQTALSRIGEFPPPLHRIGQTYALKFDPTEDDGGGKDYICSLLPYWMQESTGISDEQCERLALANIYGMLYFFIQDDVMDNAKPEKWKGQLALANLLQTEMLGVFRGLFPSDSPFWSYYDKYVTTWADCVMNEAELDYFTNDPIRTAGKAGPVKLSSTGACLLAGMHASIPAVEEAVDLTLMTLQMLDDWADWREDLAVGSYNGLLAHCARLSELPSLSSLTEERMETQIYVLGCMNAYADIARSNHERLLSLPEAAPDLLDYHAYMADGLARIAEAIESRKRMLMGGGINLWPGT